MLVVREIGREERPAFQERIARLEEGVTYPLGDDRFSIDHGEDYFAFFDRLGEVSYLAALDGEEVVAVVAAVLRRVPHGSGWRSAWYLGDLKVRPGYRGRGLVWRLLAWGVPRKILRSTRGYGVSMDPPGGRENRVVSMLSRAPLVPFSVGASLRLYSLDRDEMSAVRDTLEAARGPVSFLSLRGKKDIVLASTGEPMPLLHVQFGPCAERGVEEPQAGHVHMFCTPADDALVTALPVAPSASATVVQHGMKGQDWRFVLTSDV